MRAVYSASVTALPSPFGSENSGALSPTLSDVRGACAELAAEAIKSIKAARNNLITGESNGAQSLLSTLVERGKKIC